MGFGSLNLAMKNKKTFQEKQWGGTFGDSYVDRNLREGKKIDEIYFELCETTRTKITKEFLGKINRDIKVLEVGSNVGVHSMMLQKMGFKHLCGLEINRKAIEISKKKTKDFDIIQGSALDIPFKDNYFDLVFTSGLLIHISPKDIKKAIREIYRCTKKYIFGFEYYADKYTEVMYAGKKNMLWKTNFPKLYLDNFSDLKLVKEKKIKHLNNENVDVMFLLKKV
jgi:pseudaminic acid biosynthesis-associated methylase